MTFKELIDKYLARTITESEKQQLSRMLAQPAYQTELATLIDEGFANEWQHLDIPEPDSEQMYQQILAAAGIPAKQEGRIISLTRRRTITRWAVAAAILIILGAAGIYRWLIYTPASVPSISHAPSGRQDIEAPGKANAVITLANGQKIILDSTSNGTLATQGSTNIMKLANGEVSYKPGGPLTTDHSPLTYNTLTNPRGSRVISLSLSDGTRVWLNTASTITYPVAFTGNERKVSITGEAYFEVAHDKAKPFKVGKGDMEVQVLGTHFNVNAYDDEPGIKVTLLEGSVRVSQTLNLKLSTLNLLPGEQAIAAPHSPLAIYHSPDLDAVMAWKNGLFSFTDADLPEVMRQLSRWYDVEVVYLGAVPAGTFQGKISRDLTLSQLLNGLSSTRIHYKLENHNRLIILPE